MRGHVTPPKRLHHFSDAVGLVRRHEHVHVIGHQYIGVHRGGVSRRGLLETFQVEAIIVLMEKDWLTIMHTLDDMLWDSWEGVAG